MSSFSIHQFSSGIINPKQGRPGKWFSGGHGKEIDKESHKVPQEIKKVVNMFSKDGSRGFGIPDTHPPQAGYCALIARELDNYCVLAVANQQQDDTGTRKFIAYRYFWLDKYFWLNKQEFPNQSSFDDFDGIATLLYHWKQKGNPQYDIGEWTNSPEFYTTSWEQLKEYRIKTQFFQQKSTRVKELISSINLNNQSLSYNEPLVYEANEIRGSLEPEEVHCLAIQYSHVKNCSINWAWNVRRLENMEDLRVIYCADDKALNCFNQELIKRKERRHRPRPNESGGEPPNLPVSHADPTDKAKKTQDTKKLIQKFRGKFEEKDVLTLMSYYQEYKQDIVKFEDTSILESFNTERPIPNNQKIKYATLLTALAPQKKEDEILPRLMKLSNNKKNSVAISFLDDLLMIATQNQDCLDSEICGLFCKNLTYIRWNILNSPVTNPAKEKLVNSYFNFIQHIWRRNQSETNKGTDPAANQDQTKTQDLLIQLCSDLREEDLLNLMNYYEQCIQFVVNNENKSALFLNQMPEPEAKDIKYAVLFTALAPNENTDILSKLMELNKHLKNKVAIDFLDKLLKTASRSKNCFDHQVSERFCKNFTYTKFRLRGSVKNYISSVGKGFVLSLIPFLIFVVTWMHLPSNTITISTIKNWSENLGNFKIPPTSTDEEGLLAELLNQYYSRYKAIKILERYKNNIYLEEAQNLLYERFDKDKKKITYKLRDIKAEQYIGQLQDSDQNQVIDARQKEIYTNLEQFTPKIITEELPVLKVGIQDEVSVATLQNILKKNGNYIVGQEEYKPGQFDKFTRKAVESLQGNKSIERKGEVGPDTWNLLVGRLNDLQVEMVYTTLKKHLKLGNQIDYNIVDEIKKCQDNNQNEKALKFVNCLEQLND